MGVVTKASLKPWSLVAIQQCPKPHQDSNAPPSQIPALCGLCCGQTSGFTLYRFGRLTIAMIAEILVFYHYLLICSLLGGKQLAATYNTIHCILVNEENIDTKFKSH